jgi:uncharacterized protein YyaL (SSP411 family)
LVAVFYQEKNSNQLQKLSTAIWAKKHVTMNELHSESSPYLLQHATNPVHWKAWNTTTLQLAQNQNKLIIVSVGYSACHWCHVMEHESFENNEVAHVMNQHFINIKVDREERPDIDAVYMKAVQIMTSRGGWPMNVVCLPNGKPVWGGTYFRKEEWMDYLQQLQNLFENQPEKLIEYSEKLHLGLEALEINHNQNDQNAFSTEQFHLLIDKWKKSFDLEYGGMARAPKFMMPSNYEFLLHYAHNYNDQQLLDFVNLTLTKMAHGGLFDTLEGGFSRYSVDMKWHVPHFEKMLYDNGQLVSLYANAYKLTKNPLYKEVIQKTLQFVSDNFLSPEKGFYSALDADSINHEGHLEEGAYYVWTKHELEKLLGDDYLLFSKVFNINDFGHWENQNYVLIQNQELHQIANQNNISTAELATKKRQWEILLLKHRKKRSQPRLDDKCLCSWNALMLKGYIEAYKALQDESYLEVALQNAAFIQAKFMGAEGNLFHNYKNNKTTINGYLEDYCFVIEAFIHLYQITLNEKWLIISKQLTDYCLDYFYNDKKHFFQFTSRTDEPLITNHFEIEDNVIPGSNSVMASNLLVLSTYYNNSHYHNIALQMVEQTTPSIDYPSAYSNWLRISMLVNMPSKELAICGPNALIEITKLNAHYHPNIILGGSQKQSNLPFLKDRHQDNQTLFYACENKTCSLPVNSCSKISTEFLH